MTPTVLVIAGSDPSAGAGLQVDLRALQAARVFGMAAVTALTVQNSQGVRRVQSVEPALVAAQIRAVREDREPDAVKLGMLGSAPVTRAVAEALAGCPAPLVIDPVLRSTSGRALLDDDGLGLLLERLLPGCALVTPNLPERAVLARALGVPPKQVGPALLERGAGAVLTKGGHGPEQQPIEDRLERPGAPLLTLRHPRLPGPSRRGTGCALASWIAAGLARGQALEPAVRQGIQALTEGWREAVATGRGAPALYWRR